MAEPKKTLLEWFAITAIRKAIISEIAPSQEKITAQKTSNSLGNFCISK